MRERKFRHRGGVSLHRRAPEKSNVYLNGFLSKVHLGRKNSACIYILVTLMIGCEVVVVEDADVEDGVVGADAHVADGQEGNHFDGTVAVVTLTSLTKQILV